MRTNFLSIVAVVLMLVSGCGKKEVDTIVSGPAPAEKVETKADRIAENATPQAPSETKLGADKQPDVQPPAADIKLDDTPKSQKAASTAAKPTSAKPSAVAVADSGTPKALDISYITSDHIAALIVHPQRLMKSPLLASVPQEEILKNMTQESGIDMRTVERAMLLVSAPQGPPGPEMVAAVVHFTESVDGKALATKMWGAVAEGEVEGKKYYKQDQNALFGPPMDDDTAEQVETDESGIVELGDEQDAVEDGVELADEVELIDEPQFDPGRDNTADADVQDADAQFDPNALAAEGGYPVPALYAPDDRTLVFASEENLKKMITGSGVTSPLTERLAAADLNNDLVVVANLEPLKPMLQSLVEQAKQQGSVPPAMMPFTEYPDHLKAFTLIASLSDEVLLKVQMEGYSEDSGVQLQELTEGAVATGKTMLGAVRQQLAQAPEDVAKPILTLVDQLFAGISIDKDAARVVVTIKKPAGLEDFAKNVAPMIVAEAQEAAQRAQRMNNLKQIALALHNFYDVYQKLPTGIRNEKGDLLLSWRVQLLPFIEASDLYDQFKLDESWDSRNNKALIEQMPDVFRPLGDQPNGKTAIQVFVGEGTPFGAKDSPTFASITDGTSNTIFCVEAGPDKAVEWTRPADLPFNPDNPLAALGNVPLEGFLAAMFDGSVRVIQSDLDAATLKALITHAGGEAVDGF